MSIEFEWTRAFQKVLGKPAYEFRDGLIRQTSRGKQAYSPLATPALYLKFSQLDGSPPACVGFASNFGLLEKAANSNRPPTEALDFWRSEIKKMKALVGAGTGHFRTAGRISLDVTSIDIGLVYGMPDMKPKLIMHPSSLLSAMRLQLAQALAGGAAILTCQQCGTWFEAGADAKRSVAKFCSDKCRFRFNYERRVKK